MTNTTASITFSVVLIAAISFILMTGEITFGNITSSTYQYDTTEKYTFFATSTNQTVGGTTTTALSTSITPWLDTNGRLDNGYMVVEGAERVTFWFDRQTGGGNAGSTAFDVDVSYDGVTWQDYGYLKSATSSATYASVTLVGTSTSVVSLDLTSNTFYAVRCNVTETTDGTHLCKAIATY